MRKAILVGALAVLQACQGVPRPRSEVPPVRSDAVLVDPKAKGSAADTSVAGLPDADGDGTVKLIEPGAEPRVVRRYAFVAGRVETRVGQASDTLTIKAPGAPPEQSSEPVFDVTMRLSTEGDGGSGVFPFRITVEKVELAAGHGLDARSATEARNRLPPLVGTTAKVDVTAQGRFGELTLVDDEKGAKPGTAEVVDRLGRLLEVMVVPFPEEAIGVGARWEVASTDVVPGGKDTSVARYLLKEWTGDGGTVTQEHLLRARTSAPGAPSTTFTAEGRYTFLVKLDRPTPKMSGEVSAVATLDVPHGDHGPPPTASVRALKTRHSLETPAGR